MEFDTIIRGGLVIDGSGQEPARRADVGIVGDRIVAVDALDGATAGETIDAAGKIVAPGFIDVHVHSETALLGGPHRYGAPRVAQPRTPLIGRATELERVVALLAPGRIISVVGAGGAGKTRLALEVLIRHGDDFGGGTFVDLSSVTDPDTVAAVVADAVGMPFGSDVSIPDVVAFLCGPTGASFTGSAVTMDQGWSAR